MKEKSFSNDQVREIKLVEALLSFLFEDFVEVGLQFFYFEKFTFLPGDSLVYFNAIFMLVKAIELATRNIIWVTSKDNDQEKLRFFASILIPATVLYDIVYIV